MFYLVLNWNSCLSRCSLTETTAKCEMQVKSCDIVNHNDYFKWKWVMNHDMSWVELSKRKHLEITKSQHILLSFCLVICSIVWASSWKIQAGCIRKIHLCIKFSRFIDRITIRKVLAWLFRYIDCTGTQLACSIPIFLVPRLDDCGIQT